METRRSGLAPMMTSAGVNGAPGNGAALRAVPDTRPGTPKAQPDSVARHSRIAKRMLTTVAYVIRKRVHVDSWLDPAIHLAIIVSSLTAAFLLRFDFSIPPDVVPIVKEALCIALVVKLPIFELAGFHRSLWRFADVTDLFRIFVGNAAATILFTGVTLLWIGPAMPRSVVVIDALLCLLGTALVRLSVRLYNEVRPPEHNAQDSRA